MVYYNVDGKYIDAEPVKDHGDNSMILAYKNAVAADHKNGVEKPRMHILDNKASAAFKAAMRENCDLQLVPLDTYHWNLVEQVIQMLKSHFIAILTSIDPSFPMSLWDCIVPQVELTLNLLHQANANPSISTYQYHGVFDYNKMPLGPLG